MLAQLVMHTIVMNLHADIWHIGSYFSSKFLHALQSPSQCCFG
jgi:hypothetical protein